MYFLHTWHGVHGVVVSHPLRMQKALGSNPSVSIAVISPNMPALLTVFSASAPECASFAEMWALHSSVPFLLTPAAATKKRKNQARQPAQKHGKGLYFVPNFGVVR